MGTPPSEPCLQCGGETAAGYSICPHCGASLLVDVTLDRAVADAKKRFALAKSLTAISNARTFSGEQAALQAPCPVVAERVTRALAQRYLEAARSAGVEARMVPSDRRAPTPRVKGGKTWLIAAAVSLLAIVASVGLLVAKRQPAVMRVAKFISRSEPALSTSSSGDISKAVVDRALAATVSIRCPTTVGSGFFVDYDRVLTNKHVVCSAGEKMEVVVRDGRSVLGKTVASNDALDLAVIEVAGASSDPLPLGDAAALTAGDVIAVVGSPRGMEFTLTKGSVSYVGRTQYGIGYLQLDANINPGNSGGPVIDAQGRAVGVVSAMVKDSNGLGLALPINYATDGASPLIAPDTGARSDHWAEFLSSVAREDDRQVERARSGFARPGIAAAAFGNHLIVAALLRRFDASAVDEPVGFAIERNGNKLCTLPPERVTWSDFDNSGHFPSGDKRMLRWIREHHLQDGFKLGLISAKAGNCPADLDGAELVLPNGEPAADRALLVPASALVNPTH